MCDTTNGRYGLILSAKTLLQIGHVNQYTSGKSQYIVHVVVTVFFKFTLFYVILNFSLFLIF